ncbi:MAG: hypothetical protein GC192_02900 [Bacteroidetes bacterium]|nr:hypothetical protein [Bacteroidota bacterium]
MKNRAIICLIYLSTLSVLSFGQQTTLSEPRTPDATQLLEIQRGELEFFKTIVYRFEVAWEESDVQSMVDLRKGLMKLMANEIGQLKGKNNPTKAIENRLEKEIACLNSMEITPIAEGDDALGKHAEKAKAVFNDFIKLLEEDFTEQANALRLQKNQ